MTFFMQRTNYTRKTIIICSMILSMFSASLLSSCASAPQENMTTTIYLVRHAEKITGPDAGRNPDLSADGKARADLLVGLLADKGITHIHSTNYIRTKDTAAPLAKILGLEVAIYDPRDLPGLAALIKEQGSNHLVVGHSNTTPETVAALGGDGGAAIHEPTEYDRLYKVSITNEGIVSTNLTRYGTLYMAEDK